METTREKTRKEMQIDELKLFADTLKQNGYTVIIADKYPFEWLHYAKDGKIGHVYPNYFGGFNFSTVHRPCRECGTGFGVGEMVELTLENADKALIFGPSWATHRQLQAIQKYDSVESLMKYAKWSNPSIY